MPYGTMASIKIGELAALADLNPKTIRYYEAIGLLPLPARSPSSGYRRYDQRDLGRLQFIRRAKLLGLSLDEIRDVLAARSGGASPCAQVWALIDAKLKAIEQHIRDLQAFRGELATLRAHWLDRRQQLPGAAQVCPIIEQQTEVGAHADPAPVLAAMPRRRRPHAHPAASS